MQDTLDTPASALQVAKEVATDPGVGFGVVDCLLFAGGNPVGFVACLTATAMATGAKALAVRRPAFLKRHPKFAEIVSDNRTPLRLLGLSLLLTAGAACAAGAVLPAVASAVFALANFKIAESVSGALKKTKDEKAEKKDKPARGLKNLASLALKGPHLYINLGLALAGFMAGGASLCVLPVVATALSISLNNSLKNKPENAGHPTAIAASANAVFAGIGFASGNLLPAVAFVLNTAVLLNVEARVTKGGFSQVMRDAANGMKSLFTKNRPSKAFAPVSVLIPAQEPTVARVSMERIDQDLSAAFKATASSTAGDIPSVAPTQTPAFERTQHISAAVPLNKPSSS